MDQFGDDRGPERITAVIPGGGWRYAQVWRDKETHSPHFWSAPLVGWGLLAKGWVVALETDADGVVVPADTTEGVVWHPDAASGHLPATVQEWLVARLELKENQERQERQEAPRAENRTP